MQMELDSGLVPIHARLQGLANSVCEAVDEVVGALLAWDKGRMYQVMLNDLPINRETRAIAMLCHEALNGSSWSGVNARFLISALRMTVALERIGDYAVTVARVGVRLSELPARYLAEEVTGLAVNACHMLQDAIEAFSSQDVQLARDTSNRAKTIDGRHNRIFHELVEGRDDSLSSMDRVSLLTIISRLERVSDQAKNICEETLFMTLGETKRPKTYRVLFVEGSRSLFGPLAVQLARKRFPESGAYRCATLEPVDAVSPTRMSAPDVNERTPDDHRPALAAQCIEENEYHVVVGLEEEGQPLALPSVAFRTVILRWTVDSTLEFSDISARLTKDIEDLMQTLRGESAN